MNLYLTSDDYIDFESVRKIISYKYLKIDGEDILEVQTDEPIIGQKYGLENLDTSTFYLINRYKNDSLTNLVNFPIHVNVCIIRSQNISNPSSLDELQSIAWAMVYDNFSDAKIRRI